MIERHIIIDNVDPVTFYGVNNSNIQLIRNLFPKLRMAARGSVITAIGDENETADFDIFANICNGLGYIFTNRMFLFLNEWLI